MHLRAAAGPFPAAQRLACALACALAACAPGPRPAPPAAPPPADGPPVSAVVSNALVRFDVTCLPADAGGLGLLSSALLQASARTQRWGTFRHPIEVRVLPDHAALEAAVGRPDHPWLRGWSFAELILLQSPRTWGVPSDDQLRKDLAELLAHELTHALMYQALEQEGLGGLFARAEDEEPPLWFREGMASLTAGQGDKRPGPAELAAWQRAHPGVDLLRAGPELVRTEKEAVYGAAHRAFEVFLALRGDVAVRDILRSVRNGARFADAFRAATGLPLDAFERHAARAGFDPVAARAQPLPSGAGGP